MPTPEERISALERKVTGIEIQMFAEQSRQRTAQERAASEHARDIKDIHQDLTILLGLVTVQNEDTKAINAKVDTLQEDVGSLKQDVGGLKQDVGSLKQDVGGLKQDVVRIGVRLDRQDQRLDRLETKSDQHTELLTQILARLPEKP